LLATIRLPELLGPVALAHLQGAGVVWKTTFGSDHVWERCIMACEPCFTLHPSMFQGAARHALMHCYSPLGRCTIGIGEEPLLRSAEEAQRLARLLHRMEKARDAHMSKGGRVADILVGRLQLSQRKASHGDKGEESFGSRHVFKLPQELNECFGGCPELMVRLGSGHKLRVRFSETSAQQKNDQHQKLVLDLGAASSEVVLDYRRCAVNLDRSCCDADVGMQSFRDGSMTGSKDSSPEILCAFFIRDGGVQMWKPNLALI